VNEADATSTYLLTDYRHGELGGLVLNTFTLHDMKSTELSWRSHWWTRSVQFNTVHGMWTSLNISYV